MSTSMATALSRDFFEIQNNIRFEFLKNRRARKFRTVSLITLLITLLYYLIPIITGTDFPENGRSYLSNVLAFSGIAYVLYAMFLGADSINREHAEGSDLLLYPLPQRRSNIIIAKYIAQLLSSWFAIILYYAIIILSMGVIYGFEVIPETMATSMLFSFAYMATILAFSFLVSALLSSPATSMAMTFFGLQIILPMLNMLLGLADVDVSWVFTNYSGLVTSTMGIQGGAIGPGMENDLSTDFTGGLTQITLQGLAFFAISLFMGSRKEVGA